MAFYRLLVLTMLASATPSLYAGSAQPRTGGISPAQAALEHLQKLLENAVTQTQLPEAALGQAALKAYELTPPEDIATVYQAAQAQLSENRARQEQVTAIFTTALQSYSKLASSSIRELQHARLKNGIITGVTTLTSSLLSSLSIAGGIALHHKASQAARAEKERRDKGFAAHALYAPDAALMSVIPAHVGEEKAARITAQVTQSIRQSGDNEPIAPASEMSLRTAQKFNILAHPYQPPPTQADTARITPAEFQQVYKSGMLASDKEALALVGQMGGISLMGLGLAGHLASGITVGVGLLNTIRLSSIIATLEKRPAALAHALHLPLSTAASGPLSAPERLLS